MRGQPLFDAAFAKLDTAESGTLSRAQVKAVVEKIWTFQGKSDHEIKEEVDARLDRVMSAEDLDSDGNISKEAAWKYMAQQEEFSWVEEDTPEEVDQLFFSIEEFIETKLCAADERSAKEAEWQAKRQAKEAEAS